MDVKTATLPRKKKKSNNFLFFIYDNPNQDHLITWFCKAGNITATKILQLNQDFKRPYLFWARLILHSCQTRSTICVASRCGILPPWWLVLSTLKRSEAEGILTHFWAEWESTGQENSVVNTQNVGYKPLLINIYAAITCRSLLGWSGRGEGHQRHGGLSLGCRHLVATRVDSSALGGPHRGRNGDVWLGYQY